MDSFFSFFHILDYCYTVCQENDLGGFLGAISPQLWEDSMPIDMAIYNDWSAGCADGDIDEENILIFWIYMKNSLDTISRKQRKYYLKAFPRTLYKRL